jgi:Phage capsid family
MPTGIVAQPNAGLRDRLQRIEARIAELRDQIKAAQDDQARAQEAYASLEDLATDSDQFKEAKEATRRVGELGDQLAAMQSEQVEVLRMLSPNASASAIASQAGGQAGPGVHERNPHGWTADAVLTPEVIEQLERYSGSSTRMGTMRIGEVVTREDFAADIAPTANMRRGDYYGILPQLQRPLTLLDLMPSGSMSGSNIPYTQEGGLFTGAAETAEGAMKPEAEITFTDAEAIARVIAAWMKMQKAALSDVPALRAVIDQRLRYLVLRRLEAQIINGNGTAPNLRGLLNTTGIGTVAFNGAELVADQVLTGITNVLLADALADVIVMHPLDWAAVLKVKAPGDGHYYGGGPFSVTPQVMWGVNLLASAAMPVGHVLVADMSIATTLYVREGIQVLFSDSDGTDFRENRVTLLGEGRFALPVWRPSAIVDVDIAA